jgi:hypothetical protein
LWGDVGKDWVRGAEHPSELFSVIAHAFALTTNVIFPTFLTLFLGSRQACAMNLGNMQL